MWKLPEILNFGSSCDLGIIVGMTDLGVSADSAERKYVKTYLLERFKQPALKSMKPSKVVIIMTETRRLSSSLAPCTCTRMMLRWAGH